MLIDARTKLYLLLGNPVAHSLSPPMHNAAFASLGLNCAYLACPVDRGQIGTAVYGIRALAVAGANVTAPFKEEVIACLDSVSEQAALVRSVNTIVNRSGRLHGATTDGEGFYLFLRRVDPAYTTGQTVLVVGAGGAARAVAYTLAEKGAGEIIIANRSQPQGRALANLLTEQTPLRKSSYTALDGRNLAAVLPRCRLVVYSLPVDVPEFNEAFAGLDGLEKNQILIDLRYKPEQTGVMKTFEQKGGHACNGLGMLVWQAVKSFQLFTGEEAPVEVMQKAAGSGYL